MIEDLISWQREALTEAQKRAHARSLKIAVQSLSKIRRQLRDMRVGSWGWASRMAVMVQLQQAITEMAHKRALALPAYLKGIAKISAKQAAVYLRALDAKYLGAVKPLDFDAAIWVDTNADRLSKVRLRQYTTSFNRYGAAAVSAIEEEIASTIVMGESWLSAKKRVWDAVKHVVADKEWMVERIVRTETSAAYNGMQLEALAEEDEPDDPMFKRLVAVFDNRTGADSVMLHGQVQPVHKPFYDPYFGREYMAPPNRPNDREMVVGWRARYGAYFAGDHQYVTDTATPIGKGAPVPATLRAPKRHRGPFDAHTQIASAELAMLSRQISRAERNVARLPGGSPDAVAVSAQLDMMRTRQAALRQSRDAQRTLRKTVMTSRDGM